MVDGVGLLAGVVQIGNSDIEVGILSLPPKSSGSNVETSIVSQVRTFWVTVLVSNWMEHWL